MRWPEGPPHLALNLLYICCRKRIPSNLSLLEVKFGCLKVTKFYSKPFGLCLWWFRVRKSSVQRVWTLALFGALEGQLALLKRSALFFCFLVHRPKERPPKTPRTATNNQQQHQQQQKQKVINHKSTTQLKFNYNQ